MIESLFVLLAGVAASSACLAFLCYRRSRQLVSELTQTSLQIRSANSKAEATEARVEELADAFLRLRGKFYATRRESQSQSSNSESREEATDSGTDIRSDADMATKQAWKAKLREKYLIRPNG